MFKGYFFVLQYAPFRLAIKPISKAEKPHFAPWNGLFRTVKWAISESGTNFSRLWHRVSERVVQTETASTTLYLTFLYISFAKIFCQNFVKKNCKYVPQVFLKKKRNTSWKLLTRSVSKATAGMLRTRDDDLTVTAMQNNHIPYWIYYISRIENIIICTHTHYYTDTCAVTVHTPHSVCRIFPCCRRIFRLSMALH